MPPIIPKKKEDISGLDSMEIVRCSFKGTSRCCVVCCVARYKWWRSFHVCCCVVRFLREGWRCCIVWRCWVVPLLRISSVFVVRLNERVGAAPSLRRSLRTMGYSSWAPRWPSSSAWTTQLFCFFCSSSGGSGESTSFFGQIDEPKGTKQRWKYPMFVVRTRCFDRTTIDRTSVVLCWS